MSIGSTTLNLKHCGNNCPINIRYSSTEKINNKNIGCIFDFAMEAQTGMIYVALRKKIRDMLKSKSTLLWLEGANYEQVNQVQMKGEKLILSLTNGTIKLVQFEKYSVTSVGVQFWSQGRPGVLYKWDLPENINIPILDENSLLSIQMPDEDPNPPNLAA
ncbi:MAG: hypothetical protein V4591_01990 [Bdellovibrionota bacterium]